MNKLTQDEREFIDRLLQDHIICNPVRQGWARVKVAQAISTKLTGKNYDVDHTSAERLINQKLRDGKIKFIGKE